MTVDTKTEHDAVEQVTTQTATVDTKTEHDAVELVTTQTVTVGTKTEHDAVELVTTQTTTRRPALQEKHSVPGRTSCRARYCACLIRIPSLLPSDVPYSCALPY